MRAFFGLTEQYREQIHKQIFLLTYHTNIEFKEIMAMPTGLRRWYVRELQEQIEKEKEQVEDSGGSSPRANPTSPSSEAPSPPPSFG